MSSSSTGLRLAGIDNFIVTSSYIFSQPGPFDSPGLLSRALRAWPNWRLVAPMPRHVQDGKGQACLVAAMAGIDVWSLTVYPPGKSWNNIIKEQTEFLQQLYITCFHELEINMVKRLRYFHFGAFHTRLLAHDPGLHWDSLATMDVFIQCTDVAGLTTCHAHGTFTDPRRVPKPF